MIFSIKTVVMFQEFREKQLRVGSLQNLASMTLDIMATVALIFAISREP